MTEKSIIEGLFRDYGHPRFREINFHGYSAAPRHTRMFFSMRVFENEIENGGLAQFLWNVFFHWRAVTEDCSFGYAAIGAEKQAAAMPEIIRLLEAHETMCGQYVARAMDTKDAAHFQTWYAAGERAMNTTLEELFYSNENLDILKQAWISSHQSK